MSKEWDTICHNMDAFSEKAELLFSVMIKKAASVLF